MKVTRSIPGCCRLSDKKRLPINFEISTDVLVINLVVVTRKETKIELYFYLIASVRKIISNRYSFI